MRRHCLALALATAALGTGAVTAPPLATGAPLRLGATGKLTLDGRTVAITVLGLIDPAPKPPHSPPLQKGNHLVAVRLRIKNLSSEPMRAAPCSGALVISAKGTSLNSCGFFDRGAGNGLGAPARFLYTPIASGESRTGLIRFPVYPNFRVTRFSQSEVGGFGKTVVWRLR